MSGTIQVIECGAEPHRTPANYWEERAREFASEGEGLRAICSYGMPWFYNQSIHLSQYLALERWLNVIPGTRVLDVGCGVGRWSRLMARDGADVTGVDISPTMLAEADRRAAQEGVADRCEFVLSDLARLEVSGTFDLVVGVTVLQHLLDRADLVQAVKRLKSHLAPGGRIVLLEAMPSKLNERCDTAIFTARTWAEYRDIFTEAGLTVKALTGVDPAPFKIQFLPHYRRLPRALAQVLLAGVTLLGLPIDLVLGRRWVEPSWHKVAVLTHSDGGSAQ